MHKYGNDREIYIALQGADAVLLDGKSYPVGPGNVIVNRLYGEHGIENTGDERPELLVFEVGITES